MKVRSIPGYYYDEQKKKYFKITKDFKPPPKIPTLFKKCDNKHRKKQYSFAKEVYNRSMRGTSIFNFRRLQEHNFISNMVFSRKSKSFPYPIPNNDGCYVQRTRITQCGRKLLVLVKNGGYLTNSLCEYDVYSSSMKKRQKTVKFSLDKIVCDNTNVTSFCWEPNDDKRILYSQVTETLLRPGFIKRSSSIVISTLTADLPAERENVVKLKKKNAYFNCVAWNQYEPDSNMFCAGDRSGSINIFDVNGTIRKYFIKSAPQVLTFCKTSPCLLIGCQAGLIHQLDYRSNEFVHVSCFKKSHSIDCMKTLQDENYILASNWNGVIFLADMRMRKAVLEYKGHVNNHSNLSFEIDARGEFLFAVGSDNQLRSWDIRNGLLEHASEISPHGIAKSNVAVLQYSDRWSGDGTHAGLLCLNNDVYDFWKMSC